MSVLSTSTKAKIGGKAAKTSAKNPKLLWAGAQASRPVAKFSVKAGKPVAKRRARERAVSIGESARSFGESAREFGETLVTYGPQAAQELGLVEAPKPKRTAPRVAAGVIIGATAVYFLEPEHGQEHRAKVAKLVS